MDLGAKLQLILDKLDKIEKKLDEKEVSQDGERKNTKSTNRGSK